MVTVTVQDAEPPQLQDCSGLSVQTQTDPGAPFATVAASLNLTYPAVVDNSGETLTVVASTAHGRLRQGPSVIDPLQSPLYGESP
jgi:hypothetical protein